MPPPIALYMKSIARNAKPLVPPGGKDITIITKLAYTIIEGHSFHWVVQYLWMLSFFGIKEGSSWLTFR